MNWNVCIERYTQDLEEGLIERRLGLPWDSQIDACNYQLVWNDMELAFGRRFSNYVEEHGMSASEPVDLMLVVVSPIFDCCRRIRHSSR